MPWNQQDSYADISLVTYQVLVNGHCAVDNLLTTVMHHLVYQQAIIFVSFCFLLLVQIWATKIFPNKKKIFLKEYISDFEISERKYTQYNYLWSLNEYIKEDKLLKQLK